MSLENIQSNNLAKEILIEGASVAGAAEKLGLSPEQALKLVSLKNRRQKQEAAYRGRSILESEWQQKQKSLANQGFQVDLPDKDLLDPGVVDPFGEDQSDFQNFRPDDVGFTVDEDTGELRRETFTETRGPEVRIAPKSVLADALERLQQGTQAYGYDAFPGSADAEGRLEDDLRPNRVAEASLARDLVRQDSARFSPEMQAENYEAAGHIADTIARTGFTVNGPGAMADEAIGRIREIRKLGTTMEPAVVDGRDVMGDFQDAIVIDGVWRNPQTLEPLAIQGPQRPDVFQGSNTPNTGQVLNVPQGQNATSWLQSNVPEYREGGRVFGDFPQVDIIGTATNFAQKLKDYGIEGVPDDIRTLAEVDKAIQIVGADYAAQGKQPFRFDAQTGKNLPSTAFGAEELMTALRMSGPERAATANMLYQLSVAESTQVNQNQKSQFLQRTATATPDINFNAAEALLGETGAAQIAQIPPGTNVTTGFTASGKPVRQTVVSQLRGLDADPSVTMPFMGAVVDPKTRELETDAGPGYLTRFKGLAGPNQNQRHTLGEGAELEAAILDQARKRAGKKPVDMEIVRRNQQNALEVERRAAEQAAADAEALAQRRALTPANLRSAGKYDDSDIQEIEQQIRDNRKQRAAERRAAEVRRRRTWM